MTVVIITAFLNYDWDIRVKFLKEFLEKRKHTVVIITADFDHRNKIDYKNESAILIHVPKYKKNLSLSRIWSHYVFSKRAINQAICFNPDIVYVITPPNFLFYFLSRMKKRNQETKIICEIEDLWPEALPIDRKIKTFIAPVLNVWKKLRNYNIKCADAVIFECDRFRKALTSDIESDRVKSTIYLSRNDTLTENTNRSINETKINFVYLGSLNNLIDINLIIEILKSASQIKECVLHIVGKGERLSGLLDLCEKNHIRYINHGAVYDTGQKEKIFSECHFALNIMKEDTYVGATMKSLEYFHYGIPIVNNIAGDTKYIVHEFKCGVNISWNSYKREISNLLLMDSNSYANMRINSRKVYKTFFSPISFEQNFSKVLDSIM